MRYFFILGTNPTLSIAEILAVFPGENYELINKDVFLLDTEEINAQEMIKKLGGTIKIGKIEKKIENKKEQIAEAVSERVKEVEGKFNFGISYYGEGKYDTKPLGMEAKNKLKSMNINSRFVTSREKTLSSVVVKQNKLTKPGEGSEFVLIKSPLKIPLNSPLAKGAIGEGGGKEFLFGRTLAVQPFKELSFRDYGRPARDDFSGMLPPKLAQIMINLATAGTGHAPFLLDPFCGSGTILSEAMLMGYKNLIGSDLSGKAVEDTKKNLEWIKTNYQLPITNDRLYNVSATEISKVVKPNSIDAIATEPFLGPQRGKIDFIKIKQELEKLYSDSLREFYKILKPKGRVVMIFPFFTAPLVNSPLKGGIGTKQYVTNLDPNLNGFKIVNPIPEDLRKNKILKLTERGTIIYGREGQKVWREIVVLKK